MRRSLATRVLTATALVVLAATPVEAGAQTCRGMPRRGGIAFVHSSTYGGPQNGVAVSLAGGRTAIGGGFRSQSEDLGVSAWGADLRFSVLLGAGNLQICPGLGLDYTNEDWDIGDGLALTTRIASAQAGVGLGYEREVYEDLTVAPFLGLDYQFTAWVFTLDSPETTDDELSGDTLSHFNIRYGVLAQYKFVYAGVSADRYSDTKGSSPYLGRWIVGVSFGGGNRATRQAPVSRSVAARAAERR